MSHSGDMIGRNEGSYRLLFENNPQPMWVYDLETLAFLSVNNAAIRKYGYSREEFLGMTIADIRPQSDISRLLDNVAHITEGLDEAGVWHHRKKDGTIITVEVISHTLVFQGKRAELVLAHDITDRKRMESILKERTKLLEESQRIARIGSYVFHLTTGVMETSPVLDEIFGIDGQTYPKNVEGWLSRVHPAEREEMRHYLTFDVVDGKMPFDRAYRILRLQDGEERWVHGRGEPVFDREGGLFALMGTIQDITEEKRAEEHRRKLEEQLQQVHKLESLGVLAGGIAHDFNNLLQGVFGYISMAKLNFDKREKALAMLDQAEKALTMSVNLTNQLLTFSKGGRPAKRKIALLPVIEDAVKFALSGSHSDYHFIADKDLMQVEGDEGQIGQVIQNIVMNASEAMPDGGRVEISARNIDIPEGSKPLLSEGGRFVQIIIKDSGVGIPEQHLSRIFDPYFTSKQKGSGLGLATSYSVVRNHGGMIEVASEPGKGSTFSIYLPSSEAEEKDTEISCPADGVKGKILLMDDEEMVRAVAMEMIAALGHEATAASNGEDAVEKFRQATDAGRPFDLAILDLTVRGGMGGEQTVRILLDIDPHLKAVASSGYADTPVASDFRSYGFTAFLNKPYRIEGLKDILNSLLAGAQGGPDTGSIRPAC